MKDMPQSSVEVGDDLDYHLVGGVSYQSVEVSPSRREGRLPEIAEHSILLDRAFDYERRDWLVSSLGERVGRGRPRLPSCGRGELPRVKMADPKLTLQSDTARASLR